MGNIGRGRFLVPPSIGVAEGRGKKEGFGADELDPLKIARREGFLLVSSSLRLLARSRGKKGEGMALGF